MPIQHASIRIVPSTCDDGDLSNQDFRFEDWSCFSDGGDAFPSFLGGTQHCSQEIIFAVEVGILGCVRHKNLLSARGYCAEGQERLIVQMKIAVTSAHAIALNQTRYTEWFSPLVYTSSLREEIW
ncbi:unnamed protein product [Brassica oleracea]